MLFSLISITKILNFTSEKGSFLLSLFSDFLYCKTNKFHLLKEQTPYFIESSLSIEKHPDRFCILHAQDCLQMIAGVQRGNNHSVISSRSQLAPSVLYLLFHIG